MGLCLASLEGEAFVYYKWFMRVTAPPALRSLLCPLATDIIKHQRILSIHSKHIS